MYRFKIKDNSKGMVSYHISYCYEKEQELDIINNKKSNNNKNKNKKNDKKHLKNYDYDLIFDDEFVQIMGDLNSEENFNNYVDIVVNSINYEFDEKFLKESVLIKIPTFYNIINKNMSIGADEIKADALNDNFCDEIFKYVRFNNLYDINIENNNLKNHIFRKNVILFNLLDIETEYLKNLKNNLKRNGAKNVIFISFFKLLGSPKDLLEQLTKEVILQELNVIPRNDLNSVKYDWREYYIEQLRKDSALCINLINSLNKPKLQKLSDILSKKLEYFPKDPNLNLSLAIINILKKYNNVDELNNLSFTNNEEIEYYDNYVGNYIKNGLTEFNEFIAEYFVLYINLKFEKNIILKNKMLQPIMDGYIQSLAKYDDE
ncbi:hypothetical protein [Methanococcus voltae]|uniref:Uncharacterized protein n=1 Tax=Methanococcus voltae (strain ATCC BAA-1334 / A3) TaxID=456320 RepID=D7DSZ5_METV3|nr:hypothetical protein [Methanococcus voltae]MCS3901854.1 hypothetical protein [Methanococcus voltae]